MIAMLLLAGVAFGASLLTLFTGFGLGTLLLPAFALFLPAEIAVAATAIVHAANGAFKAAILAGRCRWDVVLRFGLPAVVAAFGGAALLARLAGGGTLASWSFLGREARITPLGLGLGSLIVVFALVELVGPRSLRASPRWLPAGGALSGFFGGLSGHQGALRAIFLAPLGLSAAAYAATQAVIGLLVDAARLLLYGWSFVWVQRDGAGVPWTLVAVASVSAFAGALAGRRLLPKVGVAGVHRLVGALLVVVGLALATGIA